MDRVTRYALLAELISKLERKDSWCGETHIQKATYLAQELAGLPFALDFVLYRHGPYSFDLHDELTAMRADGVLRVEPRNPPYGPSLLPTERAAKLRSDRRAFLEQFAANLDFIADLVATKSVVELERLATAFYVTREQPEKASVDVRAARLHDLKSHVSLEEAKRALEKIDEVIEAARLLIAA
jgi:uncharacterized protein YwgA